MNTKKCSCCNITKELSEFYIIRKKNKIRSDCKECVKKKRRSYGKTQRSKDLAYVNRRTIIGKYNGAKRNAKKANHSWNLSKEEYTELVLNKLCTYCGLSLPETGTSLDRKDSSKGYTIDNVVPCCTNCNTVKSNFFSFEEMLELGKHIRYIIDKRKTDDKNQEKEKIRME